MKKEYFTPNAHLLYLKTEDIMELSGDDLIDDQFDPAAGDLDW